MTHRVLVLGAGYAGLVAANRIARQLPSGSAQVTLVNAAPRFVERVRLHQAAAGQRLQPLPLAELADVAVVVGRVTHLDLQGQEVTVQAAAGSRALGYDTLVYALGSTFAESVPGVAEHAYTLATPELAAAVADRASALARSGGVLAVVGGGATGIEAATELAESHPGLRVRLVSAQEPGSWLSGRARRHLRRVFARLGVEVVSGAPVQEVHAVRLLLADGTVVAVDAVLWTTGFRVAELAREAGLAVDGRGRMLVDATLRSVSHPNVYGVGDAAAVSMRSGQELRMACATGIPIGQQAADVIVDRLAGREPRPFRFRYHLQCISLGRRDAVVQFVDAEDRPKRTVVTGRLGALIKETIVRATVHAMRHPGPRRPRRSRRVAGSEVPANREAALTKGR